MERETYFTAETIRQKSHAMLDSLASLRTRHADVRFHLGRAALLVLDMQDYFLRPDSHAYIPAAPAILPNIQNLVTAFSGHGRPVIFTQHLNTQADAGMMSRWWRDVIHAGSPLGAIVSVLESPGAIRIRKTQYDAFYETSLEELLRGRQVEQVVVSGVMTHLCCESTARSAFMRGFEVLFCVDGTATYTEALHRSALLTLAHGFALPVLCDEIAGWFSTESG